MRLRQIIIFSTVAGLALAGCSESSNGDDVMPLVNMEPKDPFAAERQALTSELDLASSRLTLATQDVESARSDVTFLSNRIRNKEAALTDYQTDVERYLMNHKMAVAAIIAGAGGSAVAIDRNNEFSDEARTMGGVAAAIALFWAMDNMGEVIEVADTLAQADRNFKEMENELVGLRSELSSQQTYLAEKEDALFDHNSDYERISTRLVNLGTGGSSGGSRYGFVEAAAE